MPQIPCLALYLADDLGQLSPSLLTPVPINTYRTSSRESWTLSQARKTTHFLKLALSQPKHLSAKYQVMPDGPWPKRGRRSHRGGSDGHAAPSVSSAQTYGSDDRTVTGLGDFGGGGAYDRGNYYSLPVTTATRSSFASSHVPLSTLPEGVTAPTHPLSAKNLGYHTMYNADSCPDPETWSAYGKSEHGASSHSSQRLDGPYVPSVAPSDPYEYDERGVPSNFDGHYQYIKSNGRQEEKRKNKTVRSSRRSGGTLEETVMQTATGQKVIIRNHIMPSHRSHKKG